MDSTKDPGTSPAKDAKSPAPQKRFRIEKLEERIAPAGHYNTQSKYVGDGNGGGGGGGGSGASSGFSGSVSTIF